MVRKLMWAGLVLVILLLGAGLWAAWFLDGDRLGQDLLEQAGQAAGMNLNAEDFRFGLFKGVELVGVSAEGTHARGDYSVRLEALNVKVRLMPLLSREVVVESVLLQRPEIRIVNSKPAPAEVPPSTAERGSNAPQAPPVEVVEVVLTDGEVVVVDATQGEPVEELRIEELEILLRDIRFNPAEGTPVRRIAATGDVRAARMQAGKLPLTGLEGKFSMAQGVLEVPDLAVVTDYGPVRARLRSDFNPSPLKYELHVQGDPLNVNRIAGQGDAGTLGSGAMDFHAVGTGTSPKAVTGEGTLRLAEGRIPDHEVLSKAERLLGMTGLAGGAYQATDTLFQLQSGRLQIDGFSLASDKLGVALTGWVDLEGPLELSVQLGLPRQGVSIRGVPPQLLDILADDRGWLTIPLQVTGTQEQPEVSVDADALKAQAGSGIGRRLGVGNLLDRLQRPR